jgi:hypothetical protein
MTDTGTDIDTCPICDEPLKPGDVCATDITEGTCHAACLEGSPVVDLETGKPLAGKADTFVYGEDDTGTGAAGLDPVQVGRSGLALYYANRGAGWSSDVANFWPDNHPEIIAAEAGARAMLSAVLSARPDVAGVVERLRAWPEETSRAKYGAATIKSLMTEAAEALTALAAECAALREERDGLKSELKAVVGHIPMDYLQRHDVPGATGPTAALNLSAAMRDYSEDRWKLIDRLKAAEAALATERERAAKMREALEKIEKAPAWGAPDKWETTPAEVRQLARAAIKEADHG